MKKLVKIIALLSVVAIFSAALAACSVKGKTYVFDKVEVKSEQSVDTESLVASATAEWQDVTLTFNNDGTFEGMGLKGYYEKSGKTVYFGVTKDVDTKGTSSFTVKGGKLVYTTESGDTTVKVYFKKK